MNPYHTLNWNCKGCSETGHISCEGEPIWGVYFDKTVHFKPRVEPIFCKSCDAVTIGLLPELDVDSFRPYPVKLKPLKPIGISEAQSVAIENDRLAKRSDEEKRIDELEEITQLLSRNIFSRLRNRSQIKIIQEDLKQMRLIKSEKEKKVRLAEIQEWEEEREIWLEAGIEHYEDLRLLDNSPTCLKCEGRNTSGLNAARHKCGGELIVRRHSGTISGGGHYISGSEKVIVNNSREVVKRL